MTSTTANSTGRFREIGFLPPLGCNTTFWTEPHLDHPTAKKTTIPKRLCLECSTQIGEKSPASAFLIPRRWEAFLSYPPLIGIGIFLSQSALAGEAAVGVDSVRRRRRRFCFLCRRDAEFGFGQQGTGQNLAPQALPGNTAGVTFRSCSIIGCIFSSCSTMELPSSVIVYLFPARLTLFTTFCSGVKVVHGPLKELDSQLPSVPPTREEGALLGGRMGYVGCTGDTMKGSVSLCFTLIKNFGKMQNAWIGHGATALNILTVLSRVSHL